MSYLVMETKTSYCVVLDSSGRFIKAANMGYSVGESISSIYPMEPEGTRQTGRIIRLAATFTALAAAFLLVFTGIWRTQTTVYGNVYFAVNPQVRIELNKNSKVLSLTGENPEGEQLIANYDFKKKDIYQVTQHLMNQALEQDYLKEDGVITLAIESADLAWEQALGTELRERSTTPQTEESHIQVRIVSYEGEESLTPPTAPEQPKPAEESEPSVKPEEPKREPTPEPSASESSAASLPEEGSVTTPEPKVSSESSAPPAPSEISMAKAKEIALSHARVSQNEAVFTKEKPDTEDGVPVYELDFETATHQYKYEITRKDGSIYSSKVKSRETSSSPARESGTITPERALEIALEHSKAPRSEIYDIDVDFDKDDNKYEVEFDWGDKEYEYDIHATTGKIIEFEIDD